MEIGYTIEDLFMQIGELSVEVRAAHKEIRRLAEELKAMELVKPDEPPAEPLVDTPVDPS